MTWEQEMLMKLVTYFKYSLVAFTLISSAKSFADINPEALSYDISNIPPQYQKDVEKALASWQTLKKEEAAFYKVLAYEIHGDNRPYTLSMVDAPLAHFIYPWSLNNQFPFATTYNTPYFTHYHPQSRMDDIGDVKGKLIAVFVDGLNYKDFQSKQKAIHVHVKKEVGDTTLLLSTVANADWDITWDEGVKINKIIIPRSTANFRIKTQSPIQNIIKSNKEFFGSADYTRIDQEKIPVNWDIYQKYRNRVKETTGIDAYSIWFGKNIKLIEIDGEMNQITTTKLSGNALDYKADTSGDSKLIFRTSDGYSTTRSERGLKVVDSRNYGLWYWEAKLSFLENLQVREKFDFGAGSDNAKFPEKISRVLKDGDVLQIALDLDDSNLYVGLNGTWIVGNPASKGSGVRLEPNRTQNPFIGVWQGTSTGEVLINFGATPYTYNIPKNYLPYDSRFVEVRKNDTAKNNAPYQLQKVDFELAQFPAPIYQRTTLQFKDKWQSFQKAIADYRLTACSLTYAYKANTALSANNLDPQCVWFIKGYFNESMYFPISELKGSQGKAKEKLPEIDTKNAKLHFIRKYSVKNQNNHELKPINLKVTDTSAPLILFIYAHEPMVWNIELAKGVKVRQIIMYGQYAQRYKFIKKNNVPVSLYSSEDRNSGIIWPVMHAGEPSASAMSEQLKLLIGLNPSSMQKECLNDTCIIDGVIGSDYLTRNEPFP